MTDRIPGAPGKCKAVVTGEELQKLQSGEEFSITLRRDDQPIKEGTPYNKASVLPDDLAEELCAEVADPAPKDALWALHNQKADTGRRKTGSEINIDDAIDDAANAPLLGLRIFGAASLDETGNEHMVGENGSVTVNVSGKNLADVQKFSADSKISTPTSATVLSNSYGTTISATTGDSIVVTQSKAPSTVNGNYQNGFFCVGFYCPLKVGDVVTISFDFEVTANLTNRSAMLCFLNDVNLSQSLVTSTRHTFRTTITESKASSADNWNYFEVRVDGKSGVFSNFQIEYGSAYTGYAPYQPVQTLTVPTPGGLPGNDVDYDEIDFAKGLLIRRCLEQSETPLPEDVMEAFYALRTYNPITVLKNDYSATMEAKYVSKNTAVLIAESLQKNTWTHEEIEGYPGSGFYRKTPLGIAVASGTFICGKSGLLPEINGPGDYRLIRTIRFPFEFAAPPVVTVIMNDTEYFENFGLYDFKVTKVTNSFIEFEAKSEASRDVYAEISISALGIWA